jgi:hypothetical protein
MKLIEFGCSLIKLDCNRLNLMKFDCVRVNLVDIEFECNLIMLDSI